MPQAREARGGGAWRSELTDAPPRLNASSHRRGVLLALGLLCAPHFAPLHGNVTASFRLFAVGHGQAALFTTPRGERIALALKYLKDNDCTKLPVGKIPIQGEQVFAIVQDKVAVVSTWK